MAMARPKTNHQAKRAEIIAAAFKSFSTYGYEGTSNTKIAAEGGFSPTLIYHYFPGGKAELFAACVEEFQSLKNLGEAVRTDTDEPPEIYFRKLAQTYLKIASDEETQRLLRMVIMEVPRFPELAQVLPARIAPVIILPVINYLMKQARAGRIEMRQPIAMIMAFYGPLLIRAVFGRVLAQAPLPLPLPTDEEMIDTVVKTFLHGLLIGNEANILPQE
jgi:AcrR family transcriptional regulator